MKNCLINTAPLPALSSIIIHDKASMGNKKHRRDSNGGVLF